jgi:hypothetical protein
MKHITTAAVLVALGFGVVGCKSDLEKYADEVCACDNMECVQKVGEAWKDKMPKQDAKKLDEMSEADQKAIAKALECSLKHIKMPGQ